MTVRTVENTPIVVGTYRETDVKGGKSLLKRWRFVDTWVNKKGVGCWSQQRPYPYRSEPMARERLFACSVASER